ncbi:AmmeMemoRadiSam system radical SAM enzyme [Desulfothermus sp.]
MTPARLWKEIQGKKGVVQCELCNHFCVLKPGERGRCGVRENRDGELYTLVYDKVAAINIDPIEKKPLYHFLPGTKTFSLGTMGCNFSCVFCQNYTLSQPPKLNQLIQGENVSARKLVSAAISYNCKSISFTYSEPTIFFELVEDTAKEAIKNGLKNVIVSNGFMSEKAIYRLKDLIHGANIDLKSFSDDFYKNLCDGRLKPVLKNLVLMKKYGWLVEITTLIIPGKNDSKQELTNIAKFIYKELGDEVPWHLSRFHPDYKLLDTTITPISTLEMGYEIGKEIGLKYVYLGNVPHNDRENTYCPECGAPLIRRIGFSCEILNLYKGKCKKCNGTISGIWE